MKGMFHIFKLNSQSDDIDKISHDQIEIFWRANTKSWLGKGQLNSKRIYEVIGSPKGQSANQELQGFLPYQTNKDRSTFFGDFLVSVGRFFLAMILVCLVGQKSL
jgi:hypothetical protein